MGRLIDADELLTRLRLNYSTHQNVSVGAIKDIIDTTKTAYDIDKKIEELEKVKPITVDIGFGTTAKTLLKDVVMDIVKQGEI